MSFEVLGNNQASSSGVDVDWDAYNKYIVETCKLEEPEPLVGIVSGIVSLGTQVPQPSVFLKNEDEDEVAETTRNPNAYYEDREKFYHDGKWYNDVRVKVVPQKPQQLVAITVDFPDIMIDRGQFFGGSEGEQPLRMILGGEFYTNGERIVAKPMSLQLCKGEKTNNQWTIPFNKTLYKMAVAAKIIKQGEPFLPDMMDKLLGKAMQFRTQVAFNDKGYLVEKCAFAAAIGRGQAVPDIDEDLLYLIQISTENSENAIKQLKRSGVALRNSIRKSEQWEEGCILKDQLEGDSKPQDNEEKPAAKVKKEDKPSDNNDQEDDFLDGFDDDVAF